MRISAGKRWVLAGVTMAALATAGIPAARAAPIPVAPEHVITPDSGITDIRYRRHRGAGGAFAGAALGILALGAAAALANGGGYYDDPYYGGGYYGGGYYPAYPYGGYRVYQRGYYGNGHHAYYGRSRRHSDEWGHSSRVGRNW
jgi:hypothetical protein